MSQTTKPLPARLKWLIRGVRAGVVLGALFLLALSVYFWTNEALVREQAPFLFGLPANLIVINDLARLLGALGELPWLMITLFAMWQLWQLFGQYRQGLYFLPATLTRLTRFGWALLGVTVLGSLGQVWLIFVFSLGSPPDGLWRTVGFDTGTLWAIFTSVVLLAVAVVLSEAARLAEENKLFV